MTGRGASSSPSAASSPPQDHLAPAVIVAAILLTFWPVVSFDFTNWDDNQNTSLNPQLNPPTLHALVSWWTGANFGLYEPLTATVRGAIALVARVPEDPLTHISLNPMVYHGVNLSLHTAVAMGVFGLLQQLGFRRWPACAAAVLFAVHPLQVEPVAWISSIKELLYGLFAICAISRVLRSLEINDPSPRQSRLYWTATGLYALASLSKVTAVVVPLMVLALVWMQRRTIPSRAWRAMLLWFLLGVPLMVVTTLVQPSSHLVKQPIWRRPLVALDSIAFYLGKIVWPANLTIDYGRNPAEVFRRGWAWWTWIFPILLGITLWIMRRRWRPAAAGALIIAAGLLPVLGLVRFDFQFYSTVADRYFYLPMFGVALIAAWLLNGVPDRSLLWTAIPLLLLATCSWVDTWHWRDSMTLMTYAQNVNPRSIAACNTLALLDLDAGDLSGAEEMARRHIALAPNDWRAYSNLGGALAAEGRLPQASAALRQACAVSPNEPIVLTDLAGLLARQGMIDQAVPLIRRAIQIDPAMADAHLNLGIMLSHQQHLAQSADEFKQAAKLNPRSIAAHVNLAAAYIALGQPAMAAAEYRAVLQIDPRSQAALSGLQRLKHDAAP